MSQIHIVTDSSAQFLDPKSAKRKNIQVVPLSFHGPNGPIDESGSVDLESIRHHFGNPATAPIVAAPSVELISDTYQRLQATTDQILSIHASASACDSVANAIQASEQFMGRLNIQVIDSNMVSVGLGLIVEAAAARAARGENMDALIRLVRGMIQRMYLVIFLEDLMYLERNQMINRSQAILGNMLGIIPFLTVEEGRIIPMEKVRSRSRALEKLVEFITEFSTVEQLVLLYEGEEAYSQGCMLIERLKTIYRDAPITLSRYNPHLATFVGLGGLGAVVLEPEQEIP
jgi:DegV family protein with EDD domain